MQKILRTVAVIILVAGLAIAALIFWKNPRDVDDESDALSKRDIYQLEKLGGKEYVFSVEINSWLSSLLAWTASRFHYHRHLQRSVGDLFRHRPTLGNGFVTRRRAGRFLAHSSCCDSPELALLLNQLCDQRGPTGLMRRAETGSVITVEIFVE